MKGIYHCDVKVSALSAARTLAYITAASSRVIEVIATEIGTSGTNVTNQQLEAYWGRITTLGTPTATSFTPTPTEHNDQAAASTVKVNVTASEPTYGTQLYGHIGFASLSGYQWFPQHDERMYIQPSDSHGLYLATAPSAADFVVRFSFREIG